MSLRRIAPRLLRCNISCNQSSNGSNKIFSPIYTNSSTNTSHSVARRGFSTQSKNEANKMTAEEVEAAMEKANESMKAYYSYPPEKVIAAKKLKFEKRHRDKQFYLQVGLASTLVCAFLITPFLGKKIAYDKEFRKKYIPDWYFYGLEKPENAWTKEELNQEIIILQRRLHERAIAGDFAPEKLEEMRRAMWKKPEKEEYEHFAQLHPGVDADEDIEDEE